LSVAADLGAPGRHAPRARQRALDGPALRALALAVLAAVLLALLTIATFAYLPRYEAAGRPILDNADFREGFRDWQLEGLVSLDESELGHATLQNRDHARAVWLRRTIELPPGRTSLRLRADIATSRVERGEKPWHTARVYLVPQTLDGTQLWDQPNRLVELIGTTSRRHYEMVFEVPAMIPAVALGIDLAYATGRLEIADLELAIVDERPQFRLVAALLVCGWSLLAFRVIDGVYHGIGPPLLRRSLLAALALLAAGAFLPAVLHQALLDALAGGFGLDVPDPDAAGHAVLFGLLALLVRAGRPGDPLLLHLSCWLLLAAVTEVLQLFTPDRDPQVGDWLMDATGAFAGLLLGELALLLQRLHEATRRQRQAAADPERQPRL
jgi:VanZ like family